LWTIFLSFFHHPMPLPPPSKPFLVHTTALGEIGWTTDRAHLERLEFDLPDLKREIPFALAHKGDERLAVLDAGGANLEPAGESSGALFERYLDLARIERFALWALAGKCDLLLLVTEEGAVLLDAARETVLGRSASTEDAATCLRALETDRPKRPASDVERLGEDLRHWFDLACGALGPVLKWARPDVERLVRQILLGLKTLVWTRPDLLAGNLSRIGVDLSSKPGAVRVAWCPAEAGSFLDVLLSCAAEFAPRGAGALGDLERRALVRQAADLGEPAARVLREMLQIARVKLEAALQIRILPNAEQEHASWRLALTEPLSVAEAMQSEDFYVFDPMRLDLGGSGFGRLLEAVEKIASSALARNVEILRAGGLQLDLVERDPEGIGEGPRMNDPFNWLCRHALRVRVADAYRDAVGYLVASYVLELRAREEFRDCRAAPLASLPAIFESVQSESA
jgi:hypothetical protein